MCKLPAKWPQGPSHAVSDTQRTPAAQFTCVNAATSPCKSHAVAANRSGTYVMAAASVAAAVRRVLVPIATGSEDIETACIVDTLRRARFDGALGPVVGGWVGGLV